MFARLLRSKPSGRAARALAAVQPTTPVRHGRRLARFVRQLGAGTAPGGGVRLNQRLEASPHAINRLVGARSLMPLSPTRCAGF
jgi:hypothetical protein